MQRLDPNRPRLTRLLRAMLGGTALAAVVAASAFASEPTITTSTVSFAGVYGPAPCLLHNAGVSTSRTESFYDDAGHLVLSRRHMTFSGTLTNVATGVSVPYQGEATITIDPVAGTRTVTGQTRRTDLPGQPPLLASGRTVFALSAPPTVLDEAGLTPESYGAEICAITGS
jgi:hypothetical protein